MDADQSIPTTSVQRPRTTGTADHSFRPDSIPPVTTPPAVGDRYHVAVLHRSGGLGRIWVARDGVLGRDVALKDLRPDRATDARLRARFVEEARITGQLEHPYIVPLYDLIDGPNGPCYTMRFVAGRTLAEAARAYHDRRTAGQATRLDLAGLLDAFVAVCRAVAYAHSRGVLHRDLKGQNIVLGNYGEVFVLDWGLAKLTAGHGSLASGGLVGSPAESPAVITPSPVGSRDETVTGAIVGTPAFLAPEQAGGASASTASDVYGLGGVLYVILTGGPPYDGPTMQEVLERVLAGPPPRPRMVNPACPPALEAVCRQAMARDPADRYPSAEAVAADVRRWLADEPVAAYREPWLTRAARWARRHRAAVAGGLAVLLTAVAGLAVSTALVWQEERRTAEQRDTAERERGRAERNLGQANQLALALLDISDTQLPMIRQTEGARKAMTAACLDSFRQSLAANPDDPKLRVQVARAYRYSANLHRLLNEIAIAEPHYHEAVRMLGELVVEFPANTEFRSQLAGTLRDQGRLFLRLGRLADATTAVRQSADFIESLLATESNRADFRQTLAQTLIDLSGYEFTQARFASSEATARRATQLLQNLVDQSGAAARPDDRLLLATALHRLAATLHELKLPKESLAASATAIDQINLLPPGDNGAKHYRARIYVEQAKVLINISGRPPEALENVTRAINLWDELQNQLPKIVMYREWQASAYEVRGRVHAAMRNWELAAADLSKAVTMIEKLILEAPEVPAYRGMLGRACLTFGRLEASRGKPQQAADWLNQGRDAFQAAITGAPENAIDRRGLDEIQAELMRIAQKRR
jgi:serine/threonine-protein kinase